METTVWFIVTPRWVERFWGPWLAITIGPVVVSRRELEFYELAHELTHVVQWREAYYVLFPFRYFLASFRAWRGGGDWYWDNAFEVEARQVARDAKG